MKSSLAWPQLTIVHLRICLSLSSLSLPEGSTTTYIQLVVSDDAFFRYIPSKVATITCKQMDKMIYDFKNILDMKLSNAPSYYQCRTQFRAISAP
jgi:hypothetical protein